MKLDLLNALAFLSALGLAMAGGGWGGSHRVERAASAPARARPSAIVPEHAPDGRPALRDAGGTLVPLTPYRRIASGSLIADRVLLDLCEPDRIVAFTRYATRGADAHRYVGKPTIDARADLERVLALRPELLLVHELVDASYVARLRERGVQVFELGPMQGLSTLLPNIRTIGHLIGAPERADRYAARLARRLEALAASAPTGPRPRALYLSVYGSRLFGAAHHTSYHDVIEYAGLRDAAAEHGLSGWPELSAERVLTIAPEVLITRTGMGPVLCRQPGLEQLEPCRERATSARLIELDGALLDDPGPALLEAAEALHAAYWRRGASPGVHAP